MRCRRTARRTRPPPTTRRAVVHRRRGRPARRRRRATNESAAEPNHLPNNQDRLAGCVMHFPRLICHLAPDTRHAIDTLPTRYVATPGRNDVTATSAFVAPNGLDKIRPLDRRCCSVGTCCKRHPSARQIHDGRSWSGFVGRMSTSIEERSGCGRPCSVSRERSTCSTRRRRTLRACCRCRSGPGWRCWSIRSDKPRSGPPSGRLAGERARVSVGAGHPDRAHQPEPRVRSTSGARSPTWYRRSPGTPT
jgi:hypothetical protein